MAVHLLQDVMGRTDEGPGNLCEAPRFPVILLYLMGEGVVKCQNLQKTITIGFMTNN